MNQENNFELDSSYRMKTIPEAIEHLKENNIKVLGEEVVFYVHEKNEVDEKPDQLIGIEDEETVTNNNMNFFDVVAIGDEVTKVKVGDKFYIHPQMAMSIGHVLVTDTVYGTIPQRLIKVIKRA